MPINENNEHWSLLIILHPGKMGKIFENRNLDKEVDINDVNYFLTILSSPLLYILTLFTQTMRDVLIFSKSIYSTNTHPNTTALALIQILWNTSV